MFSDSRGSTEHKGFKTHGSHFLPWLRNSLKSHQNHDSTLNGTVKSGSENRNNLKGFFSIQGKDKEKKGCNGVARVLPVVLRGHHILSGKQREDSPARWTQSPELDPEVSIASELEKSLVLDNHVEPKCSPQKVPSPSDQTCATLRRYGPLVVAPPALAEDPESTPPVVGLFVDNKEKVWDYSSRSFRQRDLHSASWVGPETQSIMKRHQFTSSFSFIHQQTRNSQSHRDLTSLRDTQLDRALNGVLFSTQVAQRGPGCTKTLRGPRKPRPSSERITNLEQSWFQPQRISISVGDSKRKAVRNQIKRVMDNLEHVLGALRDVQQEMKEVVQQIDYLTSSIDLNEEEPPETQTQSSSNSSSSSAVTVGSVIHRPSGAAPNTDFWRDNQTTSRSQSPPSVLLLPVSSEHTNTLRLGCRKGGLNHPLDQTHSLTQTMASPVSPQRTLPVRPPTPGLSPLTVNLQHPNSPVSQPESPSPAPSSSMSHQSPSYLKPPPPFTPSIKPGCHLNPESSRTSGMTSLVSNVRPPTVPEPNRERRAQSAGHIPGAYHMTLPLKPKAGQQGRKGRKPPPYPHHRLHEQPKPKESRKAPPYPEKRRLLSTTV
ncbi:uncharacterized protein LOC129412076 [Boleophthalmus pectinirostris]|uniref:uncharacterized protein LOC129412076 n=1 Tax=Boleophthalmus pectinirostris TaxID=150288 RepID=UPI00242D841D|nr:uncharacterized protein LOC129412076 [Boleophthalmus pectinirostris]